MVLGKLLFLLRVHDQPVGKERKEKKEESLKDTLLACIIRDREREERSTGVSQPAKLFF